MSNRASDDDLHATAYVSSNHEKILQVIEPIHGALCVRRLASICLQPIYRNARQFPTRSFFFLSSDCL